MDESENGVAKGIDRYIQQISGVGIWAYLMWADTNSETRISDLSGADVILLGGQYAFAAILIKGVSVKEVAEVIRAWRGK